ncbi:cytidylyltransferase domain-containing protein, partial [Thermodesulfobacteriota bacterium]
VQGDEPLVPPGAIQEAAAPLLADASIPMGTLKTALREDEEAADPNIVKVITDQRGFALYFSRSVIPYVRERDAGATLCRHVGLYVYRKDFLLRFTGLPRAPLEKAESLEQLRALEHGYAIKVTRSDYCPVGIFHYRRNA